MGVNFLFYKMTAIVRTVRFVCRLSQSIRQIDKFRLLMREADSQPDPVAVSGYVDSYDSLTSSRCVTTIRIHSQLKPKHQHNVLNIGLQCVNIPS